MPNGYEKQNSNVKIIHKHEFARIQISITLQVIGITAVTLLAVDLLLISMYLSTTLPEDHTLALFHGSKLFDISRPSTLPGTYLSLKLLCGSAIAGLVICTFDVGERVSAFWYLAVIVLSYLAINEMTQFETIWAEHLAITLFGVRIGQNHGPLLSQGIPIALFYAVAIIELYPRYKLGLHFLLGSSIPLVVGPLWPEISIPAQNLTLKTPLSPFIELIDQATFQIAWREGLALISSTLVITGLVITLHGMQKKVVTYAWLHNK